MDCKLGKSAQTWLIDYSVETTLKPPPMDCKLEKSPKVDRLEFSPTKKSPPMDCKLGKLRRVVNEPLKST